MSTAAPPSNASPRRGDRRSRVTVFGLVVAIPMVAMLTILVRRVGDPDYWWHLRTAQWILDHHRVPGADLYTYTATGHRWTDHEYLSELLIAGLQRVHGELAVSVGIGLITWAGFVFILLRIRLFDTSPVIAAAALALGAAVGVLVWGPRPEMVTFALLCATLYAIEALVVRQSRLILGFPLLVVLWANLHAGVLIGIAYCGLATLIEAVRWLAAGHPPEVLARVRLLASVTALALVAALATPHGVRIYTYAVGLETSSVAQGFIREWRAPDFHMLGIRPFEVLIALLVVGFALRPPRLDHLASTLVALLLALQAVRHLAILVAVATPVVAWTWSGIWRSWIAAVPAARRPHVEARRIVAALGLSVALTALVTAVVLRHELNGQAASTRANFPVSAANWLAARPEQGTRVFNEYAWGGYLADRFYPEPNRRLFIFGEADLMGDRLMNDYSDIVGLSSDWRDLLAHFGVDYVVIPVDSPLGAALAVDPAWQLAYSDSVAEIFTARSGASASAARPPRG